MLETLREILRCNNHACTTWLRDIVLVVVGSVSRVLWSHEQSNGITKYDFIRALMSSTVAVVLMEAIIGYLHVSGIAEVAFITGSSFFAYEVLYTLEKAIGTFINAVVKKIF